MTANNATIPDGVQVAHPFYQTDAAGVPISAANPLSTSATVTPAANQRVNAQANDFLTGSIVDLLTLLTLAGAPADANTVNSQMGRLTKIRDLLNGTLTVQQNDLSATGNITAAQPAQDTPVSNATVTLTLGKGNSSWSVDLRGTFSAGTTINFDGTVNGANWFSINAVLFGSISDIEVQSVVGGAPLQYQGNASGLQQIRVRASALQGGDNVSVALLSSISTDGGFLTKALPPGSALIGGVNLVDSAGTNKAAIDAAGNLVTKGGFFEPAALSAGSLNADLVPSTDVSAYKWFSLHINANAYVGTLTFQCSNDNVNWTSMNLYQSSSTTTYQSTATGTNNIWHGPIFTRFIRVRMTLYTSGAAGGTLELYTSDAFAQSTSASATILATSGTLGGTSDYHLISAATTNAGFIKASAGQVYGYEIYNSNAAARFVKLYNKASAPTVGTDTPLRTIGVPPSGRAFFHSSTGLAMGTGIAIATTALMADSDTTVVGAGDLSIDIDWK